MRLRVKAGKRSEEKVSMKVIFALNTRMGRIKGTSFRGSVTEDETGKSFEVGFMIHKGAAQELKDYIHFR